MFKVITSSKTTECKFGLFKIYINIFTVFDTELDEDVIPSVVPLCRSRLHGEWRRRLRLALLGGKGRPVRLRGAPVRSGGARCGGGAVRAEGGAAAGSSSVPSSSRRRPAPASSGRAGTASWAGSRRAALPSRHRRTERRVPAPGAFPSEGQRDHGR